MQNSPNAAKNYNKKSVSKKITRGLKCSVQSDSEHYNYKKS